MFYVLLVYFVVFRLKRIKLGKALLKVKICSFRGSLKNQARRFLTRPLVSPDTGRVRRGCTTAVWEKKADADTGACVRRSGREVLLEKWTEDDTGARVR